MAGERFFADTNLFLRYLTNDIPQQASAVEALLQRAARGEVVLVTSSLVIAEIIWTLESYYKLKPDQVAQNSLAILNTLGLDIPEREILFEAVISYKDKHVDFIDAYHAAWMTMLDIKQVYTFDQKHFGRMDGISVHVPGVAKNL